MALSIRQLREESTERLKEILAETKEKRLQYRMSIATGESVNPHEARDMRREVARLKTVLRAIDLVAGRAGVDAGAARTSLEANGWDIGRAVAATRSGGPAGPEEGSSTLPGLSGKVTT